MLGFDFKKLSTAHYETNRYEITEGYTNITVITNTAGVKFVPSTNGKTEVVCHEEVNVEHAVSVKDGTLVIELVDTRKWYEYIRIGYFASTEVTVSLPAGAYGALGVRIHTGEVEIPKDFTFKSMEVAGSTGDVDCSASVVGEMKIHLSTGDIALESLSAGALDLAATTGEIEVHGVICAGDVSFDVSTGKAIVSDMTCENLSSNGSTGSLILENVIARGKMSVERSTGGVKMEACDAAELSVKTDTGDVVGRLRSSKIFIVRTDTGYVDVPASVEGGRCEITTETGNIKIQISL